MDNLFVVLYTCNLQQELLIFNRFTELEDQTKIKSDEANQIITQHNIIRRSYINFLMLPDLIRFIEEFNRLEKDRPNL